MKPSLPPPTIVETSKAAPNSMKAVTSGECARSKGSDEVNAVSSNTPVNTPKGPSDTGKAGTPGKYKTAYCGTTTSASSATHSAAFGRVTQNAAKASSAS